MASTRLFPLILYSNEVYLSLEMICTLRLVIAILHITSGTYQSIKTYRASFPYEERRFKTHQLTEVAHIAIMHEAHQITMFVMQKGIRIQCYRERTLV